MYMYVMKLCSKMTVVCLEIVFKNIRHRKFQNVLTLSGSKYFLTLQVSDNARLSELYTSSEDSITRLEGELTRARGEVVDQHSLITSISQDKESISRAVAQNKDLKEQLAELQEAFVHKSQQNMELATALESQKYQNQRLILGQAKLSEDLTEKKRVEEMGDKREEYVREEPEGVAHPLPQDNPDQSQIQVSTCTVHVHIKWVRRHMLSAYMYMYIHVPVHMYNLTYMYTVS